MQLIIDQGNSVCKLALYEGQRQVWSTSLRELSKSILEELLGRYNIEACIYSNVGGDDEDLDGYLAHRCKHYYHLSADTPVPLKLRYERSTLGGDRLAAVCGAYALVSEQAPALVIDAGTALTYEYLSRQGVYEGGNISLGLYMRAKALNSYTSRLPLVDGLEDGAWGQGYGRDTRSAISEGVVRGFVEEIRSYVERLKQEHSDAQVLLTGGDATLVMTHLGEYEYLRLAPDLVLEGLKCILDYNLSGKQHSDRI